MKKQTILIVMSSLILMVGCSPQYVTNRQNVPLLTKKGEIKASASIGGGGVDMQVASALTNDIAVMANGQWVKHNYGYMMSDEDNTVKQKSIEAALGYYKTIGTNGVIEIYGGYGIGSSDLNDRYLDKRSKGDFSKIFIQPNVGFHSKYFSAGFGLRALYVQYDRIDETIKNTNEIPTTTTYSTILNTKDYFVEPSFTIKAGIQKFKAIGQIGASLPLNHKKFNHQPLLASLGMEYTFGK